MNESILDDEARIEGTRKLVALVSQFDEEVGGAPAFGEILEVLGVSLPTSGDLFGLIPVPFRLKAKVKGNRRYVYDRKSRIAQLNDAAFVDASHLWTLVAAAIRAAGRRDVTASELAAAIFQILNGSGVGFEDLSADDLISLMAEAPPKSVRVRVGDVVAIPVSSGGYCLAAVVAQNRFGTALGLFCGRFPFPRVGNLEDYDVHSRPVYVDSQLIANTKWPVIDHADHLLTRFPVDPEIYHAPDLMWPGTQASEFGMAESPSGKLRSIGKDEAEEVGLLGGHYRQVYVSGHLQQLLDDGTR